MLQITRKNAKRIVNSLAAGVLLFSQFVVMPAASATNNDDVTICHATNSVTNPYEQKTVDDSAVNGIGGGDHYLEHKGAVFNTSMHNGDHWGDIIPPLPGVHSGLNWDAQGQLIWNNDCSVKSSIKVVKDAQPNSSDDFDFTLVKGQTTVDSFELEDDGNNNDSQKDNKVITNLSTGDYVVTELPEASGWMLDSITCTGANYTVDLPNKKTTITLGLAQNVTCTFVNKTAGTIKLIKNVVNNNGGTAGANDFGLTIGGNATTSGQAKTLPTGTYAINEAGLSGYSFVSITGTGCPAQLGGNVTLAKNQNITCTITNDDQVTSLKVVKHVVNNNNGTKAAGDFTMNVTGTNVSDNSFPGDENGTTVTLHPGAYSVDEAAMTGYTKSLGQNCSGTIALGETKTCTITNDDNEPAPTPRTATLTIKKQADPSSAQDFSFTSEKLGNFVLDDDNDATLSNSKTFTELVAGEYIVTEQAVSDWDLAHVACQGTESYVVLLNDGKLIVNLVAGDNVTCTFVNEMEEGEVLSEQTQKGSISGHKFEDQNANGKWDNGEPALSGWTITATPCTNENTCTGTAVTQVTDQNGAFHFADLTAGLYRVCETQKSGWTQTYPQGGVCWVVTVSNDKDCVVDFGNFKKSQVTGAKFNDVNGNGKWDTGELGLKGWTISLYSVTDTLSTVLGQPVATTVTADNGTYSFVNLAAGMYKVCETQQANWTRTFPANSDCHEFTITKSGQVVTANFGNKPKPQVLPALVNTGVSSSKNMLVGLTILSILGAVHFLTLRRKDYAR